MSQDRVPGVSGKEALILELLLQKPLNEMFGLELVGCSDGQLKRGTVYVTLGRMEDKHYIESHLEDRPLGSVGLPRRLYRVTGYGQRAYAAWRMAREARKLLFDSGEVLA